jgi:heptose-I-phosphate ethanolaminephosphotransferase
MRPFSHVKDDVLMKKMQAQGRNASTRQTRNEYDNAVFCGSMFQSKVLEAIQAKRGDRALEYVYFSDHGQEVGHTQNYAGHSDSSEFGFTVPVFTWSTAPNESKITQNIKIDIPYSTQNMEHFIQGSLGITSKFYNAQLDPMSTFRKAVSP